MDSEFAADGGIYFCNIRIAFHGDGAIHVLGGGYTWIGLIYQSEVVVVWIRAENYGSSCTTIPWRF